MEAGKFGRATRLIFSVLENASIRSVTATAIVKASPLIPRESVNRDGKQFPVLVGYNQTTWTVPANRFALSGFDFHESGRPVQIVPSILRAIENPDAAGGQYR